MTGSRPHLAHTLAGLQVAEVIASAAAPTATRARLDHLGVPPWIRSALPAIKIAMSAGLLMGPREPRIGASRRQPWSVSTPLRSASIAFRATRSSWHSPPLRSLQELPAVSSVGNSESAADHIARANDGSILVGYPALLPTR